MTCGAKIMNDELGVLAQILAEWVAEVPGIPSVFLFGSRVRGDHRPDSDVDLAVFIEAWGDDNETVEWWTRQNAEDFAALKALLPGPLSIHRDEWDDVRARILEARTNPVLRVGKAVCVWTPPKSSL